MSCVVPADYGLIDGIVQKIGCYLLSLNDLSTA